MSESNEYELVSSLIYVNYRHNREISPEVSPERWEAVYGEGAKEMEKFYRAEVYRRIFWAAKQDFEVSRYPDWDFERYQCEAWRRFNQIFPAPAKEKP